LKKIQKISQETDVSKQGEGWSEELQNAWVNTYTTVSKINDGHTRNKILKYFYFIQKESFLF
jgi:hypothetical protein